MEFNIGQYKYKRDDFGSYHRVLSNSDKNSINQYYKNHIYIGGEFETKSSLSNISNKEMLDKFAKDKLKNNIYFDFLDILKITPTSNSNILDIGCGYGMFIEQWIDKEYGNGTGIDLSEISKLISHVNEHIIIADINDFNNIVIPSEISIIIASDIVEHLFDVNHFLRTIYSRVNSSTKLIIEIPIIQKGMSIDQLSNYKYFYPTRHLHLFTKEGIEYEICSSGFTIIKTLILKEGKKYLAIVEKL